MKMECMNKYNIKYEIDRWLKTIKKNNSLKVKITKCDLLDGTFDLEINYAKCVLDESGGKDEKD